jgi:predicted DNA-binding transcriptional regulator AlpA
MSDLRAMPTLDELAANPAKASTLPAEIVKELVVKHAAVGEVLLARLIVAEPKPNGDSGGDGIVGSDEVGRMLGRSRSWIEHHLDDLPPRRSLLGAPVWLRRDVEAWIKNLPKYGKNTPHTD